MTGVVASSVETISRALRGLFAAQQLADADGLLQRRDSRVVLASVTALAVGVLLTRTLSVTLVFGGVALALARASSVPLRTLVERVAPVPIVSVLIVVPQLVLLDGNAVLTLFGVTVTSAGVQYLVLFGARVAVGVTLLTLLVLTTPFSEIVAGLRSFGLPHPLVRTVAITYRFLFLLFDELTRLVLARNSRQRNSQGLREGWRDSCRLAGTFFLRTLERGERVGRGMRARGGGGPRTAYRRRQSLDLGDVVLLVGSVLLGLASGVHRWLL